MTETELKTWPSAWRNLHARCMAWVRPKGLAPASVPTTANASSGTSPGLSPKPWAAPVISWRRGSVGRLGGDDDRSHQMAIA